LRGALHVWQDSENYSIITVAALQTAERSRFPQQPSAPVARRSAR
jgi:hypothetical protein